MGVFRMKNKISFLIALSFCTICFAKNKSLDEAISNISKDISVKCESREIIAILDFKTASSDMSEYITSSLVSQISENSDLRIVTRQHMDKVEKELRFQSSGLVSDETALMVGERLGAHEIVFGSIEELENKYYLRLKVLNVEKASYTLFKSYEFNRSAKTEQLLGHAAKIYKTSLGAIAEANKNSISHISPAVGISFDYTFFRRLSFGIKALVSYDAFEKENSVYAIEPLGFVRWYAVSPTGEPAAGLFVEGQVGPEMIMVNEKIHIALSAGLTLGFRITVQSFYFEPTLRGGYPYLVGAGLGAGFRF